MRKLSAISVGLVLSCVLGLALAHAQPAVTTSGELPRNAGFLWGKVKSASGNQSIPGIAVVVYHMKADGSMGEAVTSGQTDTHGAYRIKISSLPAGTYIVKVQAPRTGALQGGMTRTVLRGPAVSKRIDWMMSSQGPAQPSVRSTKQMQVPAGGGGDNE